MQVEFLELREVAQCIWDTAREGVGVQVKELELCEAAQLRGNGPGQRVDDEIPACSTGMSACVRMGTVRVAAHTILAGC